jgi:peptidoglycan/LPS O-acetylase OafA/YrhL
MQTWGSRLSHLPPDSSGGLRIPAVVPYLPGLDGLRALAVVAVIFYHANHSWLEGGFLGVEVFFVISGYLITLLLVAESQRTGTVNLREFWIRRARRLLPALWTLLVGITIYVSLFKRSELGTLRGDVLAGFFYISNWFQIHTGSSYFSAFAFAPLRHLWSLAVEEQFYLIWPLLMFALLKLSRRRLPVIGLCFFLSAVGIAVLTAVMYRTGPISNPTDTANQYFSFLGREVARIDFVYLSTITRASGLFLGAALGVWWRPWYIAQARIAQRSFLVDVVGVLGLLSLAFMAWRFTNVVTGAETGSHGYDLLYRGGFFLVGLATVAVIAAVTHPSAVLGRVVLGNKVFVWVGVRSYGLYLYHWPIFQISRNIAGNALSWGRFAFLMACTLLVTEASYRYIETPIRKGKLGVWLRTWRGAPTAERKLHRRKMVGIAVALSLAPVFAIANLSTAKVELDAISQSLVDADAFITNLMPTTVPSTIPTSSVAGEVTTSTVAPTTVPAERIDILAIGDSVMLGAAPEMTKYGVTVDAQKSRPFKAALPIVNYVKSINALGSAVVIHLGTNSGTSQETIDSIVSVLADVPLVLVLTNSVPGKNWEESNNRLIRALPERFPNVQIIDWKKYATEHPKWLYDDLTHLRPLGQRKYTALVMEALGRPGPQFEDAVLSAPTQAATPTSSTTVQATTTSVK